MPLRQMASDNRTGGMLLKCSERLSWEARFQNAVTIEKQDVLSLGPATERLSEALVPPASGRQWPGRIELDCRHVKRSRELAACVRGCRIRVDDPQARGLHRLQTASEAISLVAADDDRD